MGINPPIPSLLKPLARVNQAGILELACVLHATRPRAALTVAGAGADAGADADGRFRAPYFGRTGATVLLASTSGIWNLPSTNTVRRQASSRQMGCGSSTTYSVLL